MGIITVKEGTTIADYGKTAGQLFIVTKGTVNAIYHNDDFLLAKGDVIGLADLCTGYFTYKYVAATEVSLLVFNCKDYKDIQKIMESSPELVSLLATSITKNLCHIIDNYIMIRYNTDNLYHFIQESYSDYKSLCLKYAVSAKEIPMDALVPYKEEDTLDTWLVQYYESLNKMNGDFARKLYIENPGFLVGYLMKTSQDAHTYFEAIETLEEYQSDIATLLLSPGHLDLFDLYTSLIVKVAKSGEDTMSLGAAISKMMIQMEDRPSIDSSLYKQRVNEYRNSLAQAASSAENVQTSENGVVSANVAAVSHSLDTILEYSDCLPEVSESFRQAIYEYKEIVDKTAVNDFLNSLRKKITKLFYQIYFSAFQVSLSDMKVPTVVKMFFLFGYVDEELAGSETAAYLYDIADSYTGDPAHGIYTLYEWFCMIYHGKKEPSRNEFDSDYAQYIHELKANGKIDESRARLMLDSNAEKVIYEMNNMFPLVNKITHGRISTYCPVLSEHNMLKYAEDQLVHPEKIVECINQIRSVDYTAFYRETLFSDMENGIPKETIQVEVLPDIILMPNTGLRGVMWQEIEGKRRTTPARFMLPSLYPEDMNLILYRITGEYRWEMCKRVQGARWNDVSDVSLTSEYFDYIQFYRKNSELSPDVREKIKLMLQKTKGSFREAFVRDYISWLTLESKGSPVLNKVNRRILFTYCPFSKKIRERLGANPLYKEYLDKYQLKRGQYLHHLDNLFTKISNSGKTIPKELEMQKKMVEL